MGLNKYQEVKKLVLTRYRNLCALDESGEELRLRVEARLMNQSGQGFWIRRNWIYFEVSFLSLSFLSVYSQFMAFPLFLQLIRVLLRILKMY